MSVICKICNESKTEDKYYPRTDGKGILQVYQPCKECRGLIHKIRNGILDEMTLDSSGLNYQTLHYKMKKLKPKPQHCQRCPDPAKELHSRDHEYTRNPEDWLWLCKSCHTKL